MFSVEFHPTYDATIGTVEDVIWLGAEAVAVGISVGSSNQVAMFEMLTKVVEKTSAWGLATAAGEGSINGWATVDQLDELLAHGRIPSLRRGRIH